VNRSFASLILILPLFSTIATAAEQRADVIVYGGTASGVIAAIAVAREGKTVLLVEPSRHIGGMVSGGLGATDTGNRRAIGGYAREFFTHIHEYYTKKYGADSAQVKACSDGFHFEPHVATLIFKEMLAEQKITPILEQRLDKVTMKGARLESFTTQKGDTFVASAFIDASYESDLMARTGVKSTVGRESKDQYGESLAGVQKHSPAHQWPVSVSPFVAGTSKLLPFVQSGAIEPPGTGDKKVQAYNFRLCMTDRKDNQVPFPKPTGYDPARYELLARLLKKKPDLKVGQLMNPVRMPNDKTDTNNNGPFSTDYIGANWAYPEADYATRSAIWKDHVTYTQGFLYFLANDPSVPPSLHAEMNRWGLAKDEFVDADHWPPQLYVREARRMLGVYVMTQADLVERRTKADSVGLGSYNTDSHHVQRVVSKNRAGNPEALNEGDFQVHVQPYAIPYGSLTPKDAECDNLLVPVCLSASHVAYGSIRMEPVYMILGHASGVAASMAVEGKVSIQKVSTDKLAAKLREQKAVLSPEGLSEASTTRLDLAKMKGIVVDNTSAKVTGEWKASSALGPLVGADYLHDGNEGKGKSSVRFIPKLTATGKYEVRLYYSPSSNRATNALVIIHSEGEEKQLRVNQRKTWKGDGVSLGVFRFAAGETGWVEVRNDGTDGHVIADAVQWVPTE
jgi:FAD dependent oxidoreductase